MVQLALSSKRKALGWVFSLGVGVPITPLEKSWVKVLRDIQMQGEPLAEGRASRVAFFPGAACRWILGAAQGLCGLSRPPAPCQGPAKDCYLQLW